MKRIVLILWLSALSVFIGRAQAFSLYEKNVYGHGGITLPYRLLRPADCDMDKDYPLFVYFHGMGKRGTDNESQLKLGGWLFLTDESRSDYPCYVLYPQTDKTFVDLVEGERRKAGSFSGFVDKHLRGEDVTVEISETGHVAYELICKIIEDHNIDRTRIYIAGSSMGAFTTYSMIAEYPDMFAAAVPMGGAADLRLFDKWKGKVPVWIIHGMKDPTVSPAVDIEVVKRLEKEGISHRADFYQDCTHDCWTQTFKEKKDFLKWIFSHSKEN